MLQPKHDSCRALAPVEIEGLVSGSSPLLLNMQLESDLIPNFFSAPDIFVPTFLTF